MKARVHVDAVRRDGKAVKLFSREINPEGLWYNINVNTKGVDLLEEGAQVFAYLKPPVQSSKNGHLIAAYPVRNPSS
jgi:hypothetical protein